MIHTEKLDSLCHINSGGTPSRGVSEYYGGDIPWAKIGDIEKSNGIIYSTEEYITKAGLESIGNRIFPKGTLLFAMYGSVGKVAFSGIELSTNQAILGIRLKQEAKEKLDLEYLKYWFQINLLAFKNRAVGGILKNLSATIVRDFDIPLPSLIDQQRIAKVLSECEVLIQKRKESIDLLDELLRSTFLELFGDPIKNEKGWTSDSLSKFGNFKNGLNFTSDEVGNNYKYLGVGDFQDRWRFTNIDSLKSITLNGIPSDDFFLQDEDIVFVRSNGNRQLVGRCVVIYPGEKKVTFSGFCIRYRLDKDSLASIYLVHLFRNKNFRREMLSSGRGANIQNISQELLNKLTIPVPPLELQDQFVRIVEQVDAVKNRFKESLNELENLSGSISQRAFKGELDLTTVNISHMEDSKKEGKVSAIEIGKQDITFMTLADYLQIPEEIQMQREGIELDFIDDPLFYQFFLKNHFKNKSFLLEDVEVLFNQIYIPQGYDYDYEKWKDYIFTELKNEPPKVQQFFDEESKVKQIKLKLTDEAFKA